MVLKEYDPMKRYGELKKNINDINEKFDKLNFIKDSLVIFHKNKYIKVIQDISNIINDIETKPINGFKTEAMINYIDDLLKYESLCEKIKQLKDFLLFKKIFENSQGKDQSECFEDGLKKLNNLKKLFSESSSNIEVIFNEENFILYLFQEKLDILPIAQNILICSNETSIEEIQSFFYRAILCEYNTLFIVEILESFNNFQHNKMYGFIDKLLSIKLENIKKDKENQKIKNIDKSSSKEYLNSFIVFVYKKLENEFSFLNELGKYTKK